MNKLLSGSNESFKRMFSLSNTLKVRFSKTSVFRFNSYSYEKNNSLVESFVNKFDRNLSFYDLAAFVQSPFLITKVTLENSPLK